MGMLSWMHEKLSSRHSSKKLTVSDAFAINRGMGKKYKVVSFKGQDPKESYVGLLTIGTFGDTEMNAKNMESCEVHHEEPSPVEELVEFTMEEVGKLKLELTKYLALKHSRRLIDQDPQLRGGELKYDCPLNKFLNCPSSLEVDRRSRPQVGNETGGEDQDDYHTIAMKNDVSCVDGTKTGISQRSITFLLKKMIPCHGRLESVPSLRDPPFLQPKKEWRMDKLFRAILRRQIYPQTAAAAAAASRKLIRSKSIIEERGADETDSRENEKCKWVKTDSEFIVLEM